MPTDDREYYGPMAARSRGEAYAERWDLDGTGNVDLADDRDHHADAGAAGGVDLADDRRDRAHGADAPRTEVAASATDQAVADAPTTLRDPEPPRGQEGAPAPPFRVAVPDRWQTQEQLRRRPESYRDEVRGERSGDEAAAEPIRVAVGERLQLPPPRFRTYGHAPPGLVSVGGRSAQSVDWSDTRAFGGVPSSQIGPVGTPPPESKPGAQASGSPPARQVEYRDDIHLAAARVRAWLGRVFGPPEDVPPGARPR